MSITWTTCMNTTFNLDDTNLGGISTRVRIPKSVLTGANAVPVGQTHIRITYTACSSGMDLTLPNAFVGHRAGSGDAYDASDLTRVTFESGSNDVTIPTGTETASDPVAFVYDNASDLIFTFFIDTTNAGGRKQQPAGGLVDTWINDPADTSGTNNVSGFSSLLNTQFVVRKVEFGVLEAIDHPIEASKLTGYAVLTRLPLIEASKLTGYAVLSPQGQIQASKLTGYAVLTPGGGGPVDETYQYSYLPVVN